jgi:hypothetical protein
MGLQVDAKENRTLPRMFIDRLNFEHIAESDLLALLETGMPEGVNVDYKRRQYGKADSDVREFLKDISSFCREFELCVAVEGDEVDIFSLFNGVLRQLQGSRHIHMFQVLLNPARTTFISMSSELDDSSIRVRYGGFRECGESEICCARTLSRSADRTNSDRRRGRRSPCTAAAIAARIRIRARSRSSRTFR